MGNPFPPIKIIGIHPKEDGEWYGVAVEFEWAAPFDVKAYKQAVWAQGNKWFDEHPGEARSGRWPLEEELQEHIARSIMSNPEYSKFFSQEQHATVNRGREGESTRVRIPKFMSLRDWSNWDVTSMGGSAMAATR